MQAGTFNKRHANRHSIDMPALLDTCWGEGILVQLKDFSTEGAYFAAQGPVERDTSVSARCILRIPSLISGMYLLRLQGRVVRTDCGGFAILLQNNHIISFADFRGFYRTFLKSPLPCASLS